MAEGNNVQRSEDLGGSKGNSGTSPNILTEKLKGRIQGLNRSKSLMKTYGALPP